MRPTDDTQLVLVDAHVHIYPCYPLAPFLDAAWENFQKMSGSAELSGALLMLSETSADHCFARLQQRAGETLGAGEDGRGWQVLHTDETESLRLEREDGAQLILVAGRQLQTREHLEVLALGTLSEFPDDRPLSETLDRVREAQALPVLPWAFGKWWGARGRLIDGVLVSPDGGELYVGDNGGRFSLGREPSQLRLARQRGIPILSGSDPLPLASEASRAGSFGFALEAQLEPSRPCLFVKAAVRAAGFAPRPYGSTLGLARFASNQLRVQLRKGRGSS